MARKKKLNHKVIVFTGATGVGKTTVKNILKEILDRINVPYYEIYAKDDLYLPFVLRQGLVNKGEILNRQEMIELMKKLYKFYGRELGTQLLFDYLSDLPDNCIYIIDSKRNPDGIRALKKLISNILVIGVSSNFSERLSRLLIRKRLIDKNFSKPTLLEALKEEQDIFDINKSLLESDIIIENHKVTPLSTKVFLVNKLIDNGFLLGGFDKFHLARSALSLLKGRKVKLPKKLRELAQKNIVSLKVIRKSLDKLYLENKRCNFFIIQGGNRFISQYFKDKHDKNTCDLKLSSLTKVSLATIVNSWLSDKERVGYVDLNSRNSIIREFRRLMPPTRKIFLEKIKNNFYGINDFITYSNLSEIIGLFCSVNIDLPFTEPSDDRKRLVEVSLTKDFLNNKSQNIETVRILNLLVRKTEIYKRLHYNREMSLFIDDIIYRGRTLLSLSLMLNIFGVARNKWQAHFLTGDSAFEMFLPTNVRIMSKGYLYPFENQPFTENGYWEEGDYFYSFRNFNDYYRFLVVFIGRNGKFSLSVGLKWNQIIKLIRDKIASNLPIKVVQSIIELYIFYQSYNIRYDLGAIIDQRPKLIGYCIPFAKLQQSFVNQAESSNIRLKFKTSVISVFKQLDKIKQTKIIRQASDFYLKNHYLFDYQYLKGYGRRS